MKYCHVVTEQAHNNLTLLLSKKHYKHLIYSSFKSSNWGLLFLLLNVPACTNSVRLHVVSVALLCDHVCVGADRSAAHPLQWQLINSCAIDSAGKLPLLSVCRPACNVSVMLLLLDCFYHCIFVNLYVALTCRWTVEPQRSEGGGQMALMFV